MKRLLLIGLLLCEVRLYAQDAFLQWKNAVQYDMQTFEDARANRIYEDLRNCYKPLCFSKNELRSAYLDSLENNRRRQNRENINRIHRISKKCKTGTQYLKIGNDLFALHQVSGSTHEKIARFKEDSLLNVLVLHYYKKAYQLTECADEAIETLFQIGEVCRFEGNTKSAFELFRHLHQANIENQEQRCKLLWSLIRCIYPENSTLDKDIASKVLPYYKEFVDLYCEHFSENTEFCIRILSELGYVCRVAGDCDYIDYCIKAAQLQHSIDPIHGTLLLLHRMFVPNSYLKNPYVMLGDYNAQLGQYEYALQWYEGTHIMNEEKFIEMSPDSISQYFEDHYTIPLFRGPNYPFHINKLAVLKYHLHDRDFSIYLNESYCAALVELIYTYKNDVINIGVDKYRMYEPILISQYNNPDARWAFNAALFIKGITNYIVNEKREFNDSPAKYRAYLDLQRQYQENPSQYALINLYRAELSLQNLRTALSKAYLEALQYTYRDILNQVHIQDVCAVEFVSAPTFDRERNKYYALIINKNTTTPIKMELCDEQELEQIYKEQYRAYSEEWSKKLYDLIWSKLEPYINDGDEVYFSPAGLLHQMNIEVVQDENGRLANEKYNLHRVSSTRELCIVRPEIERTSAVLYGGLEYNMDSEALLAQSRAYSRTDDYLVTRGFDTDPLLRGDLKKLPHSETEIATIGEYLKQHDIDYTSYTSQAGTEESFKALSGKRTPIIHLATHGFFYTNEQAKMRSFFDMLDMDNAVARPDNSLKRSGLIMAGAQRAWNGEPISDSVEDGILLAEEIAAMDLSGTDLVVLSACQTGLGEITSEGVFGLQRAFKKAGVQTLIMSLWSVADKVAPLMMQTFYREWLSGKSKHEAFAIAQQTVRAQHPDPYYWASFIMLD